MDVVQNLGLVFLTLILCRSIFRFADACPVLLCSVLFLQYHAK